MAIGVKGKSPRIREYKFFVINIKLYSESRKGATAYRQLLLDAYKKKRIGKINSEHSGIIRSAIPNHEDTFIWGSICQFLNIDEDNWVNIQNLEIEGQEIPENKHPGAKETDFVFIPSIHRLALWKSGQVSLQAIKKFLDDALPQALKDGERVETIIEQDEDVFERIFAAHTIRRLEIDITPSNGDIYEDVTALMDEEIHNMSAGSFALDVRSHENGTLSTENSSMLRGLLGVAKSNGTVKAVILNEEEKREIIETAKHPKNFVAHAEVKRPDLARQSLFQLLTGVFRNVDREKRT
jgi:hypothetical protein